MAFIWSQAGVVAGFGCGVTPAAWASSSSTGAPRLQRWMASSDAIFSTISTSSRVAPASSAPSNVAARAFGIQVGRGGIDRQTPTSSTSRRGSTPECQGFDGHARAGLGPGRVPRTQLVERVRVAGAARRHGLDKLMNTPRIAATAAPASRWRGRPALWRRAAVYRMLTGLVLTPLTFGSLPSVS